MSLTGMIRSSLGMVTEPQVVRESPLHHKAAVGVGAATFGYLNGRFPSPGKDYMSIKLPDFLGGREAPADLSFAVIGSIAALFDVVPFGLDNWVDGSADGALAMYMGRTFTRIGSEARIKALAGKTQGGTQQAAAGNVVDMRPKGARKYAMAG